MQLSECKVKNNESIIPPSHMHSRRGLSPTTVTALPSILTTYPEFRTCFPPPQLLLKAGIMTPNSPSPLPFRHPLIFRLLVYQTKEPVTWARICLTDLRKRITRANVTALDCIEQCHRRPATILKSYDVMNCTPQQTLKTDRIEENEIGGARSMYWGKGTYVQDFSWEI